MPGEYQLITQCFNETHQPLWCLFFLDEREIAVSRCQYFWIHTVKNCIVIFWFCDKKISRCFLKMTMYLGVEIFGLHGNMKIELFHGVDVFRLHSQMLLTCLDVQLDGVNILGWLQF